MFDWLKPKSTRQERGLAWRALTVITTRAPFAATASPREDPDSLVGEAVFNSEAIHEVLMELAYDIDPRRPLREPAEEALAAMSALVVLRPSWIAYCNEHFGLATEATDAHSEMSRQWVAGDTARAWPYFAQAKSALIAATSTIAELQSMLTAFYGRGITDLAGKTA